MSDDRRAWLARSPHTHTHPIRLRVADQEFALTMEAAQATAEELLASVRAGRWEYAEAPRREATESTEGASKEPPTDGLPPCHWCENGKHGVFCVACGRQSTDSDE